MLDAFSLDQLRMFIAAADERSFSAAGRKLHRAQSVISQTLTNLENQIGIVLFDRSARYPRLTDHGKALLVEARAVVQRMDSFKARARNLSEGLEPELAVAIDVMYPITSLTEAIGEFRETFDSIPLRLYIEALGGVALPVLNGTCRIGIIGSLPLTPELGLDAEKLHEVPMLTVVAPSHPLSRYPGQIPEKVLGEYVQLVLTDRSPLTAGRDFGVQSPQTWRLADLGAKHSFLCAGFGWGNMPRELVQADIDAGRLVEIIPENFPMFVTIGMFAVYRTDALPGPAGRWFIDRLKQSRPT